MTDCRVLLLRVADLPSGWALPAEFDAAVIVGDAAHGGLSALAPGSVHAVITDPPYSSGGAFRGDRAKDTGAKYLHDNETNAAGSLPDFHGDTRSAIAHMFWLQTALAQAWAAAADGAFCATFTDWRQLAAAVLALEGAGWVHRGVRPWVKPSGSYRQKWQFPAADAEFCVWGTRGAIPVPTGTWWKVSPPSPWMHRAPRGEQKRHQTEKPLGLMRDLVHMATPGSVVLDPFAGSGTTLEAALIEGRRAVGFELSADYAQIIVDRLRVCGSRAVAQQEVLL